MSANKYKPHVLVIPEDEADRKLANGFSYHPAVAQRVIDIRPPAGGWTHVLDVFEQEYVQHLRNFAAAHVVLLIDFDTRGENRRAFCENRIPCDLKSRTFLIGTSDDPEEFEKAVNLTSEEIGFALAGECAEQQMTLWGHDHLAHNLPELSRLMPILRPILFPGA